MKRHIDLPGPALILGSVIAFAALICWQQEWTVPARLLAGIAATVHGMGMNGTRVFWK